MPGNGSGLPSWLQDVLPPWFKERPSFTEALYAFGKWFTIAQGGLLLGLMADAASHNAVHSPLDTILYCVDHGWAIEIGQFVIPTLGSFFAFNRAQAQKGTP